MTTHTAVILNPNARRLSRHPDQLRAVERLARNRADVRITQTLHDLDDVARELATSNPDVVVLCGGDGTFMASLTAFDRAYGGRSLPVVVLVPAGTVATVARNLGQRGSLLRVVRRVLDDPSPLQVRERPTLRICPAGGSDLVGFTFGTGLVARFFERYEAAGADGHWTALKMVVRIFMGSFTGHAYARSVLDPLPCRLTADGKRLPPDAYSLVLCSVLRDVGLHMIVNHRAGEDPERPHLVASPLPPWKLGPQWPRVATGRPLVGDGNFDDLVRSCTVEFPDEHGPYILDGDAFHARQVTLRAGPRVRFGIV